LQWTDQTDAAMKAVQWIIQFKIPESKLWIQLSIFDLVRPQRKNYIALWPSNDFYESTPAFHKNSDICP